MATNSGLSCFDQVVDVILLDAKLFQVIGQRLPVPLAFFPLGQVEFRDEFLNTLQGNRIAVLVVVFDNSLLMF